MWYCSVIIHEYQFKIWYDGTSGTPSNRNIGYATDGFIPGHYINENLISRDLCIYPNPTDGRLNLKLIFPVSEFVSLRIVDINGRVVQNVMEREMKEGEHVIQIDLGDQAKGIYLAILVTDNVTSTRKIIKF